MENQLDRLADAGSQKLAKRSFRQLTKSGILDVDGNEITKKQLIEIFDTSADNTVIGRTMIEGEKVDIVKKYGMVGIHFDEQKYVTVTVPGGITTDRNTNFSKAAEKLKKIWEDPSKIPDSIAELIRQSGINLEDMSGSRLVDIIQSSDWVLHENIDKLTISLVPRAIHKEIKHMGGVGLAKFLKNHMGVEFFERFVSAAATGTVQAAA